MAQRQVSIPFRPLLIATQGGNQSQSTDYEARKQEAMNFMKDKVIDVDANDRELWERITDVPKVSTPWQYICFILNVIIPGKS